ncbi:oligoribonuclease NrnB/cAMP/cGMP phosphodiesterase (DHH superfamily) [Anoxybacillus tepidamans]|uniref:Oligoribonuclease NrnB/cAMP/cGMP phosphodiesterase (DHH superfamily) n=1 Tax=Anoxybacteroides tepidamans TaxID=265948 RepID=A0A7W8ISE4_9BACL|nr:oligoribonuclease [Anoxybacillus tepidamans]MBB5325880.1 oligoribonuclease NrnB/cAMP/cGMP phosphodiesterase (DHH superfamily) [Anoxybacillus tepidamans]
MIKLFTDSDLDGIGCGLLATIAFGGKVDVSYCSYRNLNERVRQFIENDTHDEAHVYITDLAVNEEVEKKLDERFQAGKHVQVIDHHVTALHFNRYPWGWVEPVNKHGKKTCATSLFYEYLVRQQKLQRSEALDEFVELVRQYDTWEWDENNNIQAKRLNDLLSMLGMDEFVQQMTERLQAQQMFSFTDMEEFLFQVEEKKIQRYIRLKQKQMVQTWIDEYCVGIVFAEQHISELGNALSKRCPHLDFIAMVNLGTKHIGFRTIHDFVNVAEFAKRFGGGGHPKASGCLMDEHTFSSFAMTAFHLPPIYHDAEQNRYNIKEHHEGIFFKNNEEQWFLLFYDEQNKWIVLCDDDPSIPSFLSFEEAERWVKRHFAAGLAEDALVIDYLQQQLLWSKEDMVARYPEAVEQYKNNKRS